MKSLTKLAGIGGAVLATAVLTGPASAATHPQPLQQNQSAVFVQTDDPSGNSIIAYDRASDGTLAQVGSYPTGGLGGVLDGSVVDHLASEGSLAYDPSSHTLYAVNAGSDTITVFAVSGDRLSRTQVISSGGTFPVSISAHGHLVYVLNALGGASIQGFYRLGHQLHLVGSWNRALGLPAGDPQFTHTPGQIAFTPQGGKLVVTTKAGGQSIDVFRVGLFGRPSSAPVVNYEASTVPFGVAFDAGGRLVVSEAGTNAVATFAIKPGGTLVPIEQVPTGQTATCWIVRDHQFMYLSNAGSANLSGYVDDGHSSLGSLGTTSTDAGTVDAAVSPDGRFLYVQTGAAGIVDEYAVSGAGALSPIGSVTVPGALGGEGIVAL